MREGKYAAAAQPKRDIENDIVKIQALVCYLCVTMIARVSLEKRLRKECRSVVGQEKGGVIKYVAVEWSGWDCQPLPLATP